MDDSTMKYTDIQRLDEVFAARLEDEETQAAWAAVRLYCVQEAFGYPPSEWGDVGNEARLLAKQIRETGLRHDWRTPPRHSEAMERLLHRLICVLEALVSLLGGGNNDEGRMAS